MSAYSTEQLFTLVAVPGLVGALMRFPYTFAVPKVGGLHHRYERRAA